MSEETTSAEQGAATEQTVVAGFLGGFPPAVKTDELPAETPAEEKPAEKPAEAPKEEQPKLAELIRARREERMAREKAEQARADEAKQLAEAKAELAKLRTADIESDPIGFAKARGWNKETQLLVGQALLYDLVPDKAPEGFRLKMFEQKQARKEAQEREERERATKQAEIEANNKMVQEYAAGLARAADSFDAGTYPESEAWFADDHDTYAKSLLATANNMAAAAAAQGKVADLSPAAVAAVLETEIAARMRRRDQSRAARPADPAVKQDQVEQKSQAARAGEKPAGSTTSTRGLGGGAPRRPAMTDAERIQRAIEAGWRTR